MLGLFDFGGLVLIIVVSFLFMLAIREIVMWYWKINQIKDSLHNQDEYLKTIQDELKELNSKIK